MLVNIYYQAPTYGGKLTELSKSMIRNMEDAYRTLEMYLMDTKFVADDVITLADISIITTVTSLNGLHPINEQRYVLIVLLSLFPDHSSTLCLLNRQARICEGRHNASDVATIVHARDEYSATL